MTLEPRINEVEKDLERHDKALGRIGTDLDTVKRDIHEIRVVLRERDNTVSFLKTVFIAILAVGILQFSATVWWAATVTSQLETMGEKVLDHETRIRIEERQ